MGERMGQMGDSACHSVGNSRFLRNDKQNRPSAQSVLLFALNLFCHVLSKSFKKNQNPAKKYFEGSKYLLTELLKMNIFNF
jgi:hypothetical protein